MVSLQNQYPYSQLIHNLLARASRDNNLDSQESHLHLSAVYATDRSVLKSVMNAPRKDRAEAVEAPTQEPALQAQQASSPSTSASTPTAHPEISEHFLEDLAFDLNRLKELKHNFETLFPEQDSGGSAPTPKKRTGKSASSATEEKAKPVELIDEIKNSKKKIKPESPRQKEQLEIIDEFIKSKPTISKGKTAVQPAAPTADLAESSVIFTENIVSETLVDLLLKQGKKDKAVEVLKKLIWKFPQKKAYFAAQIEELKK